MARVDYATLRFPSLASLVEVAGDLGLTDWTDRNVHGYDAVATGAFGCRAFLRRETGAVLLQLPGTFCESAAGSLWKLLYAADGCSRLDLCEDLALGSVVPQLIERAQAGGVVGCKVWKVVASSSGSTVYLGSRQSSVMMRCYDRRGVDRVEVELKDELAGSVWRYLITGGNVAAALSTMAGRFRAVVSSGVNRSRAAVCDFWRDMVAAFGGRKASISLPRPVPSLERSRAWLMRSVAPLLATMFDFEGASLISDILNARRKAHLPGLWGSESLLAGT